MADQATIIHAADIHLDSPLRGLSQTMDKQVAHELRRATADALSNLVELVIARKADALVLSGDIYDGDSKDYNTAKEFTRQMARLADAGVPVVMIAGNHDAQSVITKRLVLPDNVTMLSVDSPETHIIDDIGIAFHGQGFANRVVDENLVKSYPKAVPSLINVGLLHTSLAGASDHDTYAPCSPEDLAGTRYEYFALGHIHKQDVQVIERTTYAYSGNLQGRSIKETGPKGALVVTLERGGLAAVEPIPLDVARWEMLSIDIGEADSESDLYSLVKQAASEAKRAAGNRPLAVRVHLTGVGEVGYQLKDQSLLANCQMAVESVGAVLQKIGQSWRLPAAPRSLSVGERHALSRTAESLEVTTEALESALGKQAPQIVAYLSDGLLLGESESLTPEEIRVRALNDLIVGLESEARG